MYVILGFCRHNIYERIKTLMQNLRAGKSVTYHAVFFPSPYRRQRNFLNGPTEPADKRTKLSHELLDSQESVFRLTPATQSPSSSQLSVAISPLSPSQCANSLSLSLSPIADITRATPTSSNPATSATKKYEIANTTGFNRLGRGQQPQPRQLAAHQCDEIT